MRLELGGVGVSLQSATKEQFSVDELCLISPGSFSTCILSVYVMRVFRGGVSDEAGSISASNVTSPFHICCYYWDLLSVVLEAILVCSPNSAL